MEVGLPRLKRSRTAPPITDIFGLLVKRFAVVTSPLPFTPSLNVNCVKS